jgi:hypothetical protein
MFDPVEYFREESSYNNYEYTQLENKKSEIFERYTETFKPWKYTTFIERIEGQSAWRCKDKNSYEQQKRKFYYFVGKSAFNIEKVGPKIIDVFLKENLVSEYADIFDIVYDGLGIEVKTSTFCSDFNLPDNSSSITPPDSSRISSSISEIDEYAGTDGVGTSLYVGALVRGIVV